MEVLFYFYVDPIHSWHLTQQLKKEDLDLCTWLFRWFLCPGFYRRSLFGPSLLHAFYLLLHGLVLSVSGYNVPCHCLYCAIHLSPSSHAMSTFPHVRFDVIAKKICAVHCDLRPRHHFAFDAVLAVSPQVKLLFTEGGGKWRVVNITSAVSMPATK